MEKYLLVTFYILTTVGSYEKEARVVNIPQGPVKGYKELDGGLFAFYGIPYATAPTGRNKYKAALPAPVWTEVLEAVNETIACAQNDLRGYVQNRSLKVEEQCLLVNVFVPNIAEDNLPVVVYVHGGAYLFGYSNLLTYRSFVRDEKVIVVTFNYRVGVTGFLCLGTENVPGNAALKDQVLLLKWVKENIKYFGGNPDDMTLAGYSSGSSAAHLLVLSNKTSGLFSKVILESGSAFSSPCFQTNPIKFAKDYATLLDFKDVDDFNALEDFYLTRSEEFLYSKLSMDRHDGAFLMSPCVEREIEGVEMFLGDSPTNILKRGDYTKYPTLVGFTNREGMWKLPSFEQWKREMNTNFADFLPIDLKFKNNEEKELVAQKVKQFYFDNSISDKNTLSFVDYISDTFFVFSILKSVDLEVEGGNNQVYLYEYSFVHENEDFIPFTNIRGPSHCLQSFAIADGNFTYTEDEGIARGHLQIKRFLRGIWRNFITTGKPVPYTSDLPQWPPVKKDRSPYMILNESMQLGERLLEERFQFWQEIYDKYYDEPIPPSVEMVRIEL